MTSTTEAISAAFQHHAAGRPAQAADIYRAVLQSDPGNAIAHHLLGLALVDLDDLPGAAEHMGQATRADPGNAGFHANLGSIHKALGNIELSERCYRRALALDPAALDALASLGGLLHATGRLAAATLCLRRALSLNPAHPATLVNLGVALTDQGCLPQAQALLRRAVDLTGGEGEIGAEARWDLAVALLMAGDYAQGWAQFEWRRHRPSFRIRGPGGPEWDGGDVRGRTVLVHAEQGRGDSVQFARFIAPLAARGARVLLACQPELRRLLARVAGVADTVDVSNPPPYHLQVPLLSLPHYLTVGQIAPVPVESAPYLIPDPAAVAAWAARLDAMAPGRRRVGLCWAGAVGNPVDARRSLDPALLAPLIEVAADQGLALVSLQKNAVHSPPAPPGLIDLTADLADYADTAALVAALDLVISVDTSVAHIAGGVGRPVWLLNRYDGCWRWGKGGQAATFQTGAQTGAQTGTQTGTWYDSLRQFRQRDPGDWSVPLAQVAARLARPDLWLAPGPCRGHD